MEVARDGRGRPGEARRPKVIAKPCPPSLSPAADDSPTLQLERVIGCSPSTFGCSIVYHPTSNAIFYLAGSTVVLYDYKTKAQLAFLHSKSGKPFACIAISRCGRFVAAGERGSSPVVQVFDVSTSSCVSTLARAHKYGIGSLSFSPDGRLIASTGCSYDGQLCVWDCASGSLLGKQHTQASGLTVCFSEDSSFVVTSGKEHFKVWSLTQPAARLRGSAAAGGLLLSPKPASLKEFKSCTFVGIQSSPAQGAAPGSSGIYALTSSGILLLMRSTGRTIDKSVNVQVKNAFALSVAPSMVACACSSGLVRLFAARTLGFMSNLPRPAASGQEPEAPGTLNPSCLPSCLTSPQAPRPQVPSCTPHLPPGTKAPGSELYPDALGCSFDPSGARLAVVYSDRSVLIWDLGNLSKVARLRCLSSHSGGIWDAALFSQPAGQPWMVPAGSPASLPAAAAAGASSPQQQRLQQCLVTCSADGSIRVWSLDDGGSSSNTSIHAAEGAGAGGGGLARAAKTLRSVLLADSQPLGAQDAGDPQQPAAVVRCLQLSPDARHLAAGDQAGNLRVFDVRSMQLLVLREAHDSEVLCLSYSPHGFLASGSKDGMIHIFDRHYALVNTLDQHAAAVTAVRFSSCGMRLLSCGADRSVLFRTVTNLQDCTVHTYHRELVPALAAAAGARGANPQQGQGQGQGQGSTPPPGAGAGCRGVLYDLALDASSQLAVTVGQDACLRLFDVQTGRAVGVIRQEQEAGAADTTAIRVLLDPSGTLALCSCVDGSVAMYDLPTKQLLAKSAGRHSDIATAIVVARDGRSIVSVGGDGCIMQWALPPALSSRLAHGQQLLADRLAAQAAAHPVGLVEQGAAAAGDMDVCHGPGAAAAAAAPVAAAAGPGPRQAWGPQQTLPPAAHPHPGNPCTPMQLEPPLPGPAPQQPDPATGPGPGPGSELCNTLRRLQQGQPLLSADKLPRWATRVPIPSFEPLDDPLPTPSASLPQSSARPTPSCAHAAAPATALAAAAAGGVQAGGVPGAAVALRAHGPGDGVAWVSCTPGAGNALRLQAGSTPGGKASALAAAGAGGEAVGVVLESGLGQGRGQGQGSPLGQVVEVEVEGEVDEEVVLCSPVAAEHDAKFEVKGGAEEGGDGEEGAEAEEGGEGDEVVVASGGASNQLGHASSWEVPDGGDPGLGEAGLRRDLFRKHFDSLDEVSGTSLGALQRGVGGQGEGGEGDVGSRRLSLTATYRKLALSMLRAEGCSQQGAEAGAAAGSPTLHLHGTSVRGGSSGVVQGTGTCLAAGLDRTPISTPAPALQAAAGGVGLGLGVGEALVSPGNRLQASPHRRAGKLGGELAKMQERLESLQRQFEQQNKRPSPWRQQQGRGGQQGQSGEQVRAGGLAEAAAAAAEPQEPADTEMPEFSVTALIQGPAGHAEGAQEATQRLPPPAAAALPPAWAAPSSSALLQDNPMYNCTPTAVSGAAGGFAFADGPALVAFSNAMFSGGPSPASGCVSVSLWNNADAQHTGPAAVSPSNPFTIRKRSKITAPGFKSHLSPASNKFSSMSELSAAMAAESAGARAVPSGVAAEPGRRETDAERAGALPPLSAAAAAGAGPCPAGPQASLSRTPQRKVRATEEYLAAVQRLHSAAAEVAEMWGELQDGKASGPVEAARGMDEGRAVTGPSVNLVSCAGASAATGAAAAAAPSTSSKDEGPVAVDELQAQIQRGVGSSLEALMAVLGGAAPSSGTPCTLRQHSHLPNHQRPAGGPVSSFFTAQASDLAVSPSSTGAAPA